MPLSCIVLLTFCSFRGCQRFGSRWRTSCSISVGYFEHSKNTSALGALKQRTNCGISIWARGKPWKSAKRINTK